jgi:hypothetical protein
VAGWLRRTRGAGTFVDGLKTGQGLTPVPFLQRQLLGEEALQQFFQELGAGSLIDGKEALLDVGLQVGAALITTADLLGQGLVDNLIKTRMQAGTDLPQIVVLALQTFTEHGPCVSGVEALAAEHLIEEDADGEDVGTVVDGGGCRQLLRGHIGDFALGHADLGVMVEEIGAGDAEIDDLDPSLVGDEDVVRAEVAVHDMERLLLEVTERMGVLHGLADLGDDHQRMFHAERVVEFLGAAQHTVQILAEEIFHGDEVAAALITEIVDLHDVLMLQQGGQLGLGDEMGHHLRVVGIMRQEFFYHHQFGKALGAREAAPVDFGHAADADAVEQGVFGARFWGSLVVMGAIREDVVAFAAIPENVSPIIPYNRSVLTVSWWPFRKEWGIPSSQSVSSAALSKRRRRKHCPRRGID